MVNKILAIYGVDALIINSSVELHKKTLCSFFSLSLINLIESTKCQPLYVLTLTNQRTQREVERRQMMMDNLTTKEKQIDQAFKNEASQSRYSAQTQGLIKSLYLFSLEKKYLVSLCIFYMTVIS